MGSRMDEEPTLRGTSDDGTPPDAGAPVDGDGSEMLGAGIAIGIGTGVAIGVALDNVAIGIAIGASLGVALGVAMQGAKRRGGDDGGA